jgi:hypothetical protein
MVDACTGVIYLKPNSCTACRVSFDKGGANSVKLIGFITKAEGISMKHQQMKKKWLIE